jgi:hypothetical protein
MVTVATLRARNGFGGLGQHGRRADVGIRRDHGRIKWRKEVIVIVEHWIDDESSTVFEQGALEHQPQLLAGSPRKCCEITGESWNECMAKYNEHMGWEPYVPMDLDEVAEIFPR